VPSSTSETDTIVAVAVPVPGLGLLRYRVPPLAVAPPKGARVVVPLGGRTVTGCVVDAPREPPPQTGIKDILDVLDDRAFLPEAVVDLALWVGDYYASGPGEALAVAMPPAARHGRRSSFRTTQVAGVGDSRTGVDTARRGRSNSWRSISCAAAAASRCRARARGREHGHCALARARGPSSASREIVERDPFATGAERGHWSIDRDPELEPGTHG
jgi:primosomal protein N'